MSRFSNSRTKREAIVKGIGSLRSFVVFTEGSKTEVDYINRWANAYRDKVNVAIGADHGPPRELVRKAAKAKREHSRRDDNNPEYWCIFDRNSHARFGEAVSVARDNGIDVAASVPCIELWFLLHFRDQTAHIRTGKVQEEVKQILKCGKALSGKALDELVGRFDEAKARARYLDERHRGDGRPPRSNPSSNLWELVDRIREA